MGNFNKTFALILTLTIAISFLTLLMAKPANAQSVAKPSVPEFTVQYVNHSYDLAPTSTIDPYTGKTIITSQGGHFDNFSTEVKIKNQAFISTIDSNGNHTTLYYNLRFKGHYENETNWVYYPVIPTDYGSASHPVDPFQTGARGSKYLDASKSDYSFFTLPEWRVGNVPQGGQIDVQVQTLIGHDSKHELGYEFKKYYFEGEYTDWSNTQTVTIDNNAALTITSTPTPTSTPNPTPTPTIPEFPTWTIPLLLTAILTIAGLLFYHKKQKQGRIGYA